MPPEVIRRSHSLTLRSLRMVPATSTRDEWDGKELAIMVSQFGIDKQIKIAGAQQELEVLKALSPNARIGNWVFEWYWKQPGVPGVEKFNADIRKKNGGNLPTVPESVAQLRHEGRDVAWFGCAVPRGDAHAGRTETSILLALDPGVVRMEAAQTGNTAPLVELLPTLTSGGVLAASPNGVLGDPHGSTAAEGEELLATMVGQLRERLARWEPDARGRLT